MPMRYDWQVLEVSEPQLCRLSQRLALKLLAGDTIALTGELGSGKTTFARGLIRALLGDAHADVPSPTFSLVQTYDAQRLTVSHLDLYRIAHEDEAFELGAEELGRRGALIIEWPERAPGLLSANRLEIRLSEGSNASTRTIDLSGLGTWAPRLKRIGEISIFLSGTAGWKDAEASYLQGDASARAYARLSAGGGRAVLMDFPRQPDGPPIRNGLAYSRIAHLAEDVRPFVAIQGALKAAGLSVPEIYAADLQRGLLLLEDFGDGVFGHALDEGSSQSELWGAATDALIALANVPAPVALRLPDGSVYAVPPQDGGVLAIEAELLLDWYWPHIKGVTAPADVRAEFMELWAGVFDRIIPLPSGWVLRDYHSPNLMWLPERNGHRRAGILDFQDALRGPPVYDLVSLLQDARVDVPVQLESIMFEHYVAAVSKESSRLCRETVQFAYAALGAQRNTKILGIFARLARRDGKAVYLRHMPRIWGYLARDLAHPDLAGLRTWYDRNLPHDVRNRVLEA